MIDNLDNHILIVDDDDKIRDLLKDFLISNNFLVSTAINSEEALKKINVINFDVLILDIMMPGIDGYELTKIIRSSIPGIIISNINTSKLMIFIFFNASSPLIAVDTKKLFEIRKSFSKFRILSSSSTIKIWLSRLSIIYLYLLNLKKFD